ncbi:MAG: hypothetical protein WKF37_16150 [Bryobacteraceae bacterium]
MPDPITVTRLGKKFRRYHSNRPSTLKEAVLSGLRGMEAPETFWALRDVSFSVPRGVMLGVVGGTDLKIDITAPRRWSRPCR